LVEFCPIDAFRQENSMSENQIRVGVIGVGVMGAQHARQLRDGQVPGAGLAAVCDVDRAARNAFPEVPGYESYEELLASSKVDAVIIATPHYPHTPITIAAFERGLHVLVEKPLAVHKADAERMIKAHERVASKGLVFAEMFMMRTEPTYQKLRRLIQSGDLGSIQRVSWVITDWFRTEAYYKSAGWRASWRGEGGGVLLNQCPHNLDLYQWMFGMPSKVRAFCALGRDHGIEVEDRVTAYFEYESGTTATFIASTGEAPGTNRLEIAAERGRVVLENGKLNYVRNETNVSEYSRTTSEKYTRPESWQIEIPISGTASAHLGVIKNFIGAIQKGEPLIAPAQEGIKSVELANAMIYSSMKDQTVELPLDGKAYETMLEGLIANSKRGR
jgi:predicted dehydrogenase